MSKAKEETPGVGHNSQVGGIAGEALKQYVDRIERLEEEKKGIAADIKDVYAQAKATGFDVKTLRKVIQRRRIERAELEEQEQLIDLYENALGIFQ